MVTDPLALLHHRLVMAGCSFDFRLGTWRCPSCRRRGALRVRRLPDGAARLHCAARGSGASGCNTSRILQALGLTFLDVGPSHFRAAPAKASA